MMRAMRDAAGLLLAALLFRALALALIPFDGLYGQDAFAYYDYAAALAAAFARGQLPPPFFWPLGYPLHVVAFDTLLGHTASSAQFVSILAGALVAPLVYLLAREAWPVAGEARGAGLVAGLIAALGGQALISSVSTMSDSVALAWTTCSAWLLLRYARTLHPAALACAAAALGLSVISRWAGAVLAPVWIVTVLFAWRAGWSRLGWRRAWAHAVLALAAGGAIVAAQLATGSHAGSFGLLRWDLLNALRSDLVTYEGRFHFALPIGVYYLQLLIHPSYLFPLFLPVWLIGLWAVSPFSRRSEQVTAVTRALLVGWPLITYLFLAGVSAQNPRYAMAALPPVALWAGLGAAVLWRRRPAAGIRPAVWRAGVAVLVVAGLAGTSLWALRTFDRFVAEKKTLPLALAGYAAGKLPAGTPVLTFGLTATLAHYTALDVVEIYHETPETLRARSCSGEALYLYVNPADLTGQWQDLSPGVNYGWLRDVAGLEALGAFESYTLFRVGRGGCGD